jgi:hypothetical protein
VTQIPKSKIAFLDTEFQDIIYDSKDGDSTCQVSMGSTIRHTFILRKRYQTKTEPFHIHRSKYHPAHLSNLDRYSNVYHQNLYSILEFLRFHILASETIQAINPPVAPKTKVNK